MVVLLLPSFLLYLKCICRANFGYISLIIIFIFVFGLYCLKGSIYKLPQATLLKPKSNKFTTNLETQWRTNNHPPHGGSLFGQKIFFPPKKMGVRSYSWLYPTGNQIISWIFLVINFINFFFRTPAATENIWKENIFTPLEILLSNIFFILSFTTYD